MTDKNPAVGHKTFLNERGEISHKPLHKLEADRLLAEAEQRRAALMPDERSAIIAMFEAWQRLIELGWKEAVFGPKDGLVSLQYYDPDEKSLRWVEKLQEKEVNENYAME